ncbi:hypothetical protein N7495_003773 [Penicillium taxi]|uniref:uncharacterized protein n=1 Tax=Penicillium taxi TaxID=168475 RepID=UPI0025457F9D|nr:uncharacterized protein N7495_003773 [Penicillium taxi]KAJ5899029.1 hypothetical protein N7495_003773 [Penicillium taxi]
MPPSAVFSYWRRDRRASAAVVSTTVPVVPKGTAENRISIPPQLPQIPDTPLLTTTFDGGLPLSYDVPSVSESPLSPLEGDLTSAATLSSSYSLAVPLPSTNKEIRPHSCPEESSPDVILPSPITPQLSPYGLRPDHGDVEPNLKATSPFRMSFGKGLRNLQSNSADNQKHSPTRGLDTSQCRLKASLDESPVEKQYVQQKEATDRRSTDRDISGEHVHHKSGKAMLHLLNPMSLLARRRSSHVGNSRVDDVKMNAKNLVPAIPDDYDPRIRGKIVHDFSAPRPRISAQDASPQSVQSPAGRWNDKARHNDYSPVFKEHFEDDQKVLQVENKGYLQSSLLTTPAQPGYEHSIPIFARNLPSSLPEQRSDVNDPPIPAELPEEIPKELPVDTPAKVPEDPECTEPSHPIHKEEQDDDDIPRIPYIPAGLPKHLKSNASRFSFDMGGVDGSIQEKLLEEKHKAKEAARRIEAGYFENFDDEFDHDIMDDMDDLEEKIPGVNVDADDDDDDDDDDFLASDSSELRSWASSLPPVVGNLAILAPPDISNNDESEVPVVDDGSAQSEHSDSEYSDQKYPETELSASDNDATTGPYTQDNNNNQPALQTFLDVEDDDDMYFDDGEFGDLNIDDEDGGFDESVFDDVNSHLYERKPVYKEVSLPLKPALPDSDDQEEMQEDEDTGQGLKHMPSVASEFRAGSIKHGLLGEIIPNVGPARAHGGVLTEQNLEVLHNALAFAANEAATQGRFERQYSTSNRSLGQGSIPQTSDTAESQPGLMSDDSRLSQTADAMGFEDVFDDHIYNDDYADYDDPIVAAANAEALENDDEGFYGQEFGFYAQASGTANTELTNGGYFGPRGAEAITRSFSSRGKFEESLTPITERSEWSTRNSMISLKAHGASLSNHSLAGAGLAQLVDMGNLDDEMTMSALLKLRRGAWGGSNAGSPPSSQRGSFISTSEASPLEARTADEGFDSHIYSGSPL